MRIREMFGTALCSAQDRADEPSEVTICVP